MDFGETRPEPFVESVKPIPSLATVFSTLPPASADLNVYSFGEARREIVSGVQLELAALPHVKTMTNEDLRTLTQPISHYYTKISPFTSRALADYMPMRTAFSPACVSITSFFLSISISLRSSGVRGNVSSHIHNGSSGTRTADCYTLFLT